MIATTFAEDEPLAYGMFAESPVDRFEGMMGEYASWPDVVDPVVELAGVVVHSTHPIEIEFQATCRHAHLSQKLPPHARLATIATDHFLHGSGVDQLVVDGLLERLATAGAETVDRNPSVASARRSSGLQDSFRAMIRSMRPSLGSSHPITDTANPIRTTTHCPTAMVFVGASVPVDAAANRVTDTPTTTARGRATRR